MTAPQAKEEPCRQASEVRYCATHQRTLWQCNQLLQAALRESEAAGKSLLIAQGEAYTATLRAAEERAEAKAEESSRRLELLSEWRPRAEAAEERARKLDDQWDKAGRRAQAAEAERDEAVRLLLRVPEGSRYWGGSLILEIQAFLAKTRPP